jgi:hypothetical protein
VPEKLGRLVVADFLEHKELAGVLLSGGGQLPHCSVV